MVRRVGSALLLRIRDTVKLDRGQSLGRKKAKHRRQRQLPEGFPQQEKVEQGRAVTRLGVYTLSPAAASSSSVAASSFHFSSATFSRRASSFLMYSSSSWNWGRKRGKRLGRCQPC